MHPDNQGVLTLSDGMLTNFLRSPAGSFSLPGVNIQRRHWLALTAGLSLGSVSAWANTQPSPDAARTQRPILVLGDSLSAEYGLPRGTGWVALLEKRLQQVGKTVPVVNASISGDTTSGGRARLGTLLQRHQPGLVLIELGANDALRGLPLSLTQENLLAMTRQAQQAGARVVLVGMQLPPNYGRDYGTQFARLYAEVAKTTRAALVPFMLKGIADVPDSLKWFQADRIHPTEDAHPRILDNIWPELKKGLS